MTQGEKLQNKTGKDVTEATTVAPIKKTIIYRYFDISKKIFKMSCTEGCQHRL